MNRRRRLIAAVTGTRAEYGLARTILSHIHQDPGLSLRLIVTGMHLERKFGYSVREIERDGLPIYARIPVSLAQDRPSTMGLAIGKQITRLMPLFERLKPDIVLTLTDLGHTLAAAVAGAHAGIPVAHLHGGDVSGTIDESVRHATTKMAHIHFPASLESAERIRRMGEEPWRIHPIGAPGLDEIRHLLFLNEKETMSHFALRTDRPLVILALHPVFQEASSSRRQIQIVLRALTQMPVQVVAIYPNADKGREAIIEALEAASQRHPHFQVHKNLSRSHYLGLLNTAAVLVGNSSSGIIEAPAFGLPVVNIGSRQQGRQRAGNVIDIPFQEPQIRRALHRALTDQRWVQKLWDARWKSPYGQGQAGQKVARVLRTVPLTSKLLDKRMTY